jgi:aryl-alcohol dehydrogenase
MMPTTITAAVARAHKAPLTIETLHLDEIRPNEARVRLVATGVCPVSKVLTGLAKALSIRGHTYHPG